MRTQWHALKVQEVLENLSSSEAGLKSSEIYARQNQYGKNQLVKKRKKCPILTFLLKFTDFMVIVLLLAAIIAGIAGDVTDTIIILVIVLLNVLISFIQEFKAEKVMEALKKISAFKVTVIRDNKSELISSDELVPGDILVLQAGNIIGFYYLRLALFPTNRYKITYAHTTMEKMPRSNTY